MMDAGVMSPSCGLTDQSPSSALRDLRLRQLKAFQDYLKKYTIFEERSLLAENATASAANAEQVRKFATGATRDLDKDKLEPARFLSWRVMNMYFKYMHRNRQMKDGSLRDPDNWKKGIPMDVYEASLGRHYLDFQLMREAIRYDGIVPHKDYMLDTLAAMMFNVMGYAHEYLKELSRREGMVAKSSIHSDSPLRSA